LRLRSKTIAIFAVTTILLVATLHELSLSIISSSYGQLERKEVSETVGQIHGAVLSQYSTLGSKLSDWASWDDTYSFIQNNNSAYIQSNLTPVTLKTLGLDYMLFINSTGGVVYAIGLGSSNGVTTVTSVPASVLTLVTSDKQIWDFHDTTANVTGLVIIPQGPLLIASQPILTSEAQGPIQGAVVFALYIDQAFVQQLSDTVRVPVSSELYSSWEAGGAVGSYTYIPPYTYIHPVNSDTIDGYYLMNDIEGRPALVLWTTLPRDAYQASLTTVNYVDLAVIAAGAIFGATTLLLTESVLLSRVRKLAAEVSTISGKRTLTSRVSVSGDDELTILECSVNHLLTEIDKMTTQLRRSERFSAIGELAAMVAHDLRNPLQGIANAAYFLRKNPTGAKAGEMLTVIEEDVKYSNKIVNDLLDYSRNIRLELTETNPQRLVERALSMVAIPPNFHVQDGSVAEPTLRVDVDKIIRTFVNLISNAIDASPDGGSLKIETKASEEGVDFVFTDVGSGMTDEVLAKIFSALYTTKAKGMGLGLSISRRIVEAHGGRISVVSAPGRGTTFTITLPQVDPAGGQDR
jgi:signal transduction histidine kinase